MFTCFIFKITGACFWLVMIVGQQGNCNIRTNFMIFSVTRWVDYFTKSSSPYEGYVVCLKDADTLIKAYSDATGTTFSRKVKCDKLFGKEGQLLFQVFL